MANWFTRAWSRVFELRSFTRMPSLGGTRTSSGVSVSPEASLGVTAVLASVRLVSESIAGLPVSLKIRKGGQRLPVTAAHRELERILTVQPNPTTDSGEFWRTVVAWMLIRGNSYVYVQRNGAGSVIGLWPVPPTMVEVRRTPLGLLAYKLSHDQTSVWLPVDPGYIAPSHEILHYRWFGTGIEGYSPLTLAREQIATAAASTQYIGKFFANDATPGAILTVEGKLSEVQWKRLQEQHESRHRGVNNAHELAVYEGGAKLEATTLSPADAEFLAVYKMTRVEIASLYGVPPHKIGELDHATFSNIEHQSIEFVQDGLMPPINRLESVTRQLFTDDSLRIKFNVNGLKRGDTAARNQSYAIGRQWGYYSVNDVRRMEDEEPIDGGDEYLTPLNMLPAASETVQRDGQLVEVPRLEPTAYRAIRAARGASEDSPAWVTRVEHLLVDYFADMREYALGGDVVGWELSTSERETWDQMLAEVLAPPYADIVREFATKQAEALGGSFDPAGVANWLVAATERQARNINETTLAQLDEATDSDEAAAVFDTAETSRAALVAAGIVGAVGAFGRHEGARQSGAATKTWRTSSSNPRQSHQRMNGETVPINKRFSNGCMWPGDPDGGADEVAGCNCGVEFEMDI
ncbi:phage portal protein [Pseudoclavibacter sp. RFBG4]|uniref:phage portal protein n=1 Tax=Pseudoclavibacter sp. RFBG4 TaxID=2080575 RepID=UPI000CE84E74|nr:phage portal protein [Pseudoclavibacter sp. RFBG4]PPG25977.1 phage portal protein [Pseudoclavibacter sp. RFBG4]